MVTEPVHVFLYALFAVGNREPVDKISLVGIEGCSKVSGNFLVREGLHAAVRMMYDEPFPGAEHLARNHERAYSVVAGPSACVPDYVGVAFAEARELRRVEPGVHAGQYGELPCGRHGQIGLFAEAVCIFRVSVQNVAQILTHIKPPSFFFSRY